jgi:predicted phosphate transport protein (TIGR00153 family)
LKDALRHTEVEIMFLKKSKEIFFEHFILVANNIHTATGIFRENINNLGCTEEFALRIKALENKGDQYTHEIIQALNKTFITPLEREDILGLTIKLDDVLDIIEACTWRFELFNIKETDEYMKLFAKNIEACTLEIVSAINNLGNNRIKDISRHTHRINDLEKVADDLLRDGLKTLFSNCNNPIEIIKKKEIYNMMEEITDACEDVADILERIIMRH